TAQSFIALREIGSIAGDDPGARNRIFSEFHRAQGKHQGWGRVKWCGLGTRKLNDVLYNALPKVHQHELISGGRRRMKSTGRVAWFRTLFRNWLSNLCANLSGTSIVLLFGVFGVLCLGAGSV